MTRRWVCVYIVTLSLSASDTILARQSPPVTPSRSAFEVAAIRPNDSGGPPLPIVTRPGGRLLITNTTLREIIRAAYQTEDALLIGGPDWIRTARFDIEAKTDVDLPPFPPPPAYYRPGGHPAMPMLRALLGERFGLQVHRESRTVPAFALLSARADRSLGPELTPSTTDCDSILSARQSDKEANPNQAQQAGGVRTCGIVGSVEGGAIRLIADSQSMPQITQVLAGYAGRPVVDRSGLMGSFSFRLRFALPPNPARSDPLELSPATDAPSFFAAVREQLGLRLDATRDGLEVLVIDQVSKPTPN